MDSLTEVQAVISALAGYKTNVENLKKTLESLETNQSAFNSAWKSSRANTFFSTSYSALIERLSEAYTSLSSYQTKIERVVNGIVDFDKAIEYEATE